MNSTIGRIFVTLAAVALMFYGYQYAMTQGIKSLIAAQPPAPKLAPAPSFDLGGCDLGLSSYGERSGPPKPPCRFDVPAPPKVEPILTMSKEDSARIGLWFILANLAVPLALGGIALAGYWAIRAAVGRGDDGS